LIDRVVGETFGEVDLVTGILPLAQKRWRSTGSLPLDKRRNRLTGFLQRRGYDWGTIRRVLERVRENP
ncbi:MAG: RecX family transcriptional regulator, partial [Candidatus Glassbacteria bacterium]|nr:RecX family transcriptional regulator [Candidatus Glassbacteria bacterium]